jgi:serine/threonine protein kinase
MKTIVSFFILLLAQAVFPTEIGKSPIGPLLNDSLKAKICFFNGILGERTRNIVASVTHQDLGEVVIKITRRPVKLRGTTDQQYQDSLLKNYEDNRNYALHEQQVLEAMAAGGVTNVPQILEVTENSQGDLISLYKKVEGRPLMDVANEKSLGLVGTLKVFIQLAETLQSIHDMGYVHSDIKPDNILITPDGQAYIMDFGFASTIKEAFERFKKQRIPGSRYFVPYDVYEGRAPQSPQSDIHALIIAFREALTFSQAYSSDSLITLRNDKRDGNLTPFEIPFDLGPFSLKDQRIIEDVDMDLHYITEKVLNPMNNPDYDPSSPAPNITGRDLVTELKSILKKIEPLVERTGIDPLNPRGQKTGKFRRTSDRLNPSGRFGRPSSRRDKVEKPSDRFETQSKVGIEVSDELTRSKVNISEDETKKNIVLPSDATESAIVRPIQDEDDKSDPSLKINDS